MVATPTLARPSPLEGISFFAGLSEEGLRALAGRCRLRDYDSGQLVIGHGDGQSDVFFLLSGLARVTIYSAAGRQVSFRDIHPGAIFGELSAIDGRPRSAAIEALDPSRVLVMPQQVFLRALSEHPTFLLAVLRYLAGQVRNLTDRVLEFSTLGVDGRVRREILRLAEGQEAGPNQALLSPSPTHLEIANRISTHREAVTRELSRLVKMGILSRQGRNLRINDMTRLRALVQQDLGEEPSGTPARG